jgi:hypothetical protein
MSLEHEDGYALVNQNLRTVMAYAEVCHRGDVDGDGDIDWDDCPRIPYYSNPEIIYQGEPVGNQFSNSAATLREKTFFVSQYRPARTFTTSNVQARVGSQLLYGLVGLQFGSPAYRSRCSGVLYHNIWVITSQQCDNGLNITASFYGGSLHQNIINNLTNVKTLSNGLLMLRLPAPFVVPGRSWVSRTVLDRNNITALRDRKLVCLGRGVVSYGTFGEIVDNRANSMWRYGNYKIDDVRGDFLEVSDVFSGLVNPGDSGGPCFFDTPSEYTLAGIHLYNSRLESPSGNPKSMLIAVSAVADEIESIAR